MFQPVRNEEVSGSIPLSSTIERIQCNSSQNRYCVAVLFLIVNLQNFAFYTASANGHFVRASGSACRYLRFWTAWGRHVSKPLEIETIVCHD
jgi:hypothetical protein